MSQQGVPVRRALQGQSPARAGVDVVYGNDGMVDGQDRNLTFELWRMAQGTFEERRSAIVNHYNKRQIAVVVAYLEQMADILMGSRVGDQAVQALQYWRLEAERT